MSAVVAVAAVDLSTPRREVRWFCGDGMSSLQASSFPEKRSPAGQPILSVEARGYPSAVRVSRQSQRLVVLVAEEGFGMGVAKDFRLACGNPI